MGRSAAYLRGDVRLSRGDRTSWSGRPSRGACGVAGSSNCVESPREPSHPGPEDAVRVLPERAVVVGRHVAPGRTRTRPRRLRWAAGGPGRRGSRRAGHRRAPNLRRAVLGRKTTQEEKHSVARTVRVSDYLEPELADVEGAAFARDQPFRPKTACCPSTASRGAEVHRRPELSRPSLRLHTKTPSVGKVEITVAKCAR